MNNKININTNTNTNTNTDTNTNTNTKTNTKNKMAFIQNCIGGLLKKNPCLKGNNAKLGQVGGFNTMGRDGHVAHEVHKMEMKGRILALGLPLKVATHKDGLIVYPSLAFFESISTPDADPEYIKMVDYNEYDTKHAYPDINNFIQLNNKQQIETVNVQVIVNSPVYTIQHSIMVTWLFTEFVNRMGLEYKCCPNFTPPRTPWPVWAKPTYYVSEPTHSQNGCYIPYIKSGPCDQHITEQSYEQSIMTIDMAKTSSKNIYAYFPMADAETIFDPTSNRE